MPSAFPSTASQNCEPRSANLSTIGARRTAAVVDPHLLSGLEPAATDPDRQQLRADGLGLEHHALRLRRHLGEAGKLRILDVGRAPTPVGRGLEEEHTALVDPERAGLEDDGKAPGLADGGPGRRTLHRLEPGATGAIGGMALPPRLFPQALDEVPVGGGRTLARGRTAPEAAARRRRPRAAPTAAKSRRPRAVEHYSPNHYSTVTLFARFRG